MKILGIKHNVKDFGETDLFLRKLEDAMPAGADIVIGPDYSLTRANGVLGHNASDVSYLKNLSKKYSNTLIVPGTMPFIDGDNAYLEAPVFLNGEMERYQKGSDAGDSNFFESFGYNFKKGDSSRNKFHFKDKKVTLEICKDHGRQKVDRDTNLEIILSYDRNSGFYLNSLNDGFSREIVLVDSYKPKVSMFNYDSDSRFLGSIDPIRSTENFNLYEIK